MKVKEDYLKSIIGLNKQEALDKIEEDKFDCRIVCEDGEYYMLTMDMDFKRVNLQIAHDKVYDASFG